MDYLQPELLHLLYRLFWQVFLLKIPWWCLWDAGSALEMEGKQEPRNLGSPLEAGIGGSGGSPEPPEKNAALPTPGF